jgi:hypothetical protein
MREGFLDVIEVAELDAAAGELATQRNCSELSKIYPSGRYDTRLTPPAGGVYGSAAIVNAAQGTFFSESPTAVADFSDIVNTFPLGGLVPPADLEGSNRHALVAIGNRLSTFDVKPDRYVFGDALTALLTTDVIWGDFVRETGAGASTEWVLTRPTCRDLFPQTCEQYGVPTQRCAPYFLEVQDREGHVTALTSPNPPDALRPVFSLCHAVEVIHFGTATATSPQLGSRLSTGLGDYLPNISSGTLKLRLGSSTADGPQPTISGNIGTLTLRGQPVIGFQVVNYVNANVVPGVLANYAASSSLMGTVGCADSAGVAKACP